jgi:lipid-binding SYLF domain-containing protein
MDAVVKSTLQKCYAEVKGCKAITEHAHGVLVFPEVTKGGIGIGFESGQGALVENGQITGYYQTKSASVGATLGVGSKSVVVSLRTAEELKKFKESSGWDLGADAGFAMLETGTGGTVDTSNIKASVVGIAFGESGMLADVSLKGSKISPLDPKELETARGKLR